MFRGGYALKKEEVRVLFGGLFSGRSEKVGEHWYGTQRTPQRTRKENKT